VPPPSTTFYVDESIFSHALVDALTAASVAFERVGIAVPFGASDEDWLEVVGRNGWVALSRDQRIRYRTLERQALIRHGAATFTFTGGQATGEQTAQRVVELLPRMRLIALGEQRPFIYTFGLAGPLARVRLR
jgi:hypothetical protein